MMVRGMGLIIDPGNIAGCGGWEKRKVFWLIEPVEDWEEIDGGTEKRDGNDTNTCR
jgi:hypothetical protein